MRSSAISVMLRLVSRLTAVVLLAVFVPATRAVGDLLPVVNSADRTTLGPQQPVVITGSNFTNVTSVKIAGVETGSFSIAEDGKSISAVAPSSAWTSGVVTVTNPAGTGTGGFTVTFTSPSIGGPLPGTTTASANSATSFTVAGNVWGTGTLRYQWKKDGVALSTVAGNISGVTTDTLALSNLQAANAASAPGYTVVVTDDVGSATSSAAVLRVSAPPLDWNPATEFSVLNGNPNGVWSYGSMDTSFATFTPYVNKRSTPAGLKSWYGSGGDETPAVLLNGQTTSINGVPAGYVLLHPGSGNEPSVLRWTSPLSATVRVAGQFHAGDSGAMQVAVRRNNTVLWSATDAGAFDLTVTVVAGDTLNFAVYGGFLFGSTGLQVTLTATTTALPLTTGEGSKISLGTFSGGSSVRLAVSGAGDLLSASYQVYPDGSLVTASSSPYGFTNSGAAFPSVATFPSGDGFNRFPGGGSNYDHSGSGWAFAGKQTTDTTDAAAIRAGAVVGTFVANPVRADWFAIGFGGTFVVPAGGATLYVAVNESFSGDNHGSYLVSVAATPAPAPSANDRFDPGANGNITATVVQPDGKIVISGAFTTLQPFGSASPVSRSRIARLNRDGTIDFTFLSTASLDTGATSLVLQSDGKILLTGSFTSVNGVTRRNLARLLADGTLDSSFDPNPSGAVNALLVRPDGKIVIGGTFTTLQPNGAASPTTRRCLARLNPEGTLDSSFNIVFDNGESTRVTALGLQADGALLIGGFFSTVLSNSRENLARITPADALDATFDSGIPGATNISRIVPLRDGRILVAGGFSSVGGQGRGRIAILGATGVVDSFNPNPGSTVSDVAIQPDGKILVAGAFATIAGGSRNGLARLLPDGSLDTPFLADANAAVSQLALQPDGSAVVVGDFTTLGGHARNRIGRILPDGSVERALSADLNTGGILHAAVRQPDGKILLGGTFTTVAGVARANLARLNADSTLDTSFNPGASASVTAIALRPDGKIFVAGAFTTIAGTARTGLARLLTTGGIDSDFNAQLDGSATALALQSDGKLIVGGQFTTAGGVARVGLARFTSLGALDTAYNPAPDAAVTALALDASGKLIVGGSFTNVSSTPVARLARVKTDGVLDTTFNPGVSALTHAIAVQPDGKIIVGGSFTTVASTSRNYLARLDATGALDLTFNPGADAPVNTLALQADGKIVVGGSFTTLASSAATYLARLNANGTLDASYQPFASDSVNTAVLQPDGKTIVGGSFSTVGGQSRSRLARLVATGPTTSSLTVNSERTTLTWARTGPLPELAWVTFEKSTDGGATWTSLGDGSRQAGTGFWQIGGLALPLDTTLYFRARASVPSSVHGSSGFLEQIQQAYFPSTGPAITTQPLAATAPFGGTVTLSVTAPTATSYQWVKNGNSVLNGTNATLTFSPVTLADGGNYYVLANGATGTTQSAGVTLTVTVPHPTAILANDATLKNPRHLATDGTHWYVTGVSQTNTPGIFKLPFAGGPATQLFGGAALVSPLSITLIGSDVYWIDPNADTATATRIYKGPKNGEVAPSVIYAGFSVGEPIVDGSGLTTDGTKLYVADEVDGKVFSLNPDGTALAQFSAGARHLGSFSAERLNLITHEAGVLYLADAGRSDTVNSPAPKVLSIPVAGSPFTGLAAGAPLVAPSGIAYQSGKLYVADPGAQNTIWQLPTAGGTPVSYYAGTQFASIVGVAAYGGALYVADYTAGSIYRLAQTPVVAPAITTPPAPVATTNGASVSFSVVATGIPAVAYQWNFNNAPIGGATSSSLALRDVQFGQVGNYSVTISNGVGTITSPPVALSGPVVAPVFNTQPSAFASATAGGSVTLAVGATGAGLSYQWRKFGQPIAGASGASLMLSPLALFDAGFYDVVVTTGGVGFPSAVSRVVVDAPLPASALTASSTFAPRIENAATSVTHLQRAADGKVYVAGNFSSYAGVARPGFARLNSDGNFDTSFVPAPYYRSAESNHGLTAFAPVSGGQVIIAGQFSTVGGFPRAQLARLNVDGSVDPSYRPSYDFASGQIFALAVQSDGKLLVGGDFNGRHLVRLLADGSEDASFSVALDGYVKAIALQSDGQILIGGYFSTHGTATIAHVTRLSATGALDTAYSAMVNSGPNGGIETLVVQPDGKLLVGGSFSSFAGTARTGLVRLLDTGAIDAAFSTANGLGVSGGSVSRIALHSDGAILVVGDFKSFDTGSSRSFVRLLATGAIDPAFVTGSGFNADATGVASLADGSVLVLADGATGYNSGTANFTGPIARLSPTGVLDPSYLPAPRTPGTVYAVAPAPNGKWIVAGEFTHVNGQPRNNLARLNADGSTDTTFALPGTGFSSAVYSVAVQPDGKVIAGGRFYAFNDVYNNGLVRLLDTGAIDASFSTVFNFGWDIYTLALQANGRLFVGGRYDYYNPTTRRSLVRLLTDGTLDTTFDLGGTGLNGNVYTLALLPDGDVYAGGAFNQINGVQARRVVRLNSDGSQDTAFAVGSGFDGDVNVLALQSDGKLVAGGRFGYYRDAETGHVARLTSTGARDGGFAVTEFDKGDVDSLVVQSDGKIIAAGSFTSYGYTTELNLPRIARLTAGGTLDANFRVAGFDSPVTGLRFTGTGGLLVTGGALNFPGRLSTGVALLEAAAVPAISMPPATQIASLGGSATFIVTATGTTLNYQWFKDGFALPGATGSSFTVSGAQITDAGAYTVRVYNLFGSVVSVPALLTGSGAAPTITGQPGSAAAAAGSTAAITVNATGATHYQWRKLGVPIAGATNATLSLPEVSLGAAAFYDALVGNGLSVTRSAAARLVVTPVNTVQNPVAVDRSFPAIFEAAGSYGLPTDLIVRPSDGSYYVSGSGSFTSIDGSIRLGLARFNAAGVLDTTYAPEIGGGSINALALQPDGKLVLVGDFHRVNGVECNHLARLNLDGSLDTNFTHGLGAGTYDSLYAVAVQSNGKILIGGDLSSYNSQSSGNGLARLDTDGSLDTAFRDALGTGFNGTVRGIAVHTDGRIYVVGSFTGFNESNTADHLVALEPNGTRVALPGIAFQSFGVDLSAIPSSAVPPKSAVPGSNGTSLSSIVVLSDGKMIVGGDFYSFGGTTTRSLVGLLADGSYDSSFSTGGGANGAVKRLVRLSDGRLYVAGTFSNFAERNARVVRLVASGAFDRAYDFDGQVYAIGVGAGGDLLTVGDFQTAYLPASETGAARSHFARFDASGALTSSAVTRWGSFEGSATTIVPAPGGKWLVGGYFARVGGTLANNLVRLNSDGSIDASFSVAQGPLYGNVRAIAVQGDGKILVGGDFNYYGTDSAYVGVGRLLRLNADGTRDATFNLGTGVDQPVNALAVQIDGKILVGGEFSTFNGGTVSRGLIRLLNDGTLDTTFQGGTGASGLVRTLAVQNDDKILVGGDFTAFNSATANTTSLVRLHANGVIERTFAITGGEVAAIVIQLNGDILIGGDFDSVAGSSRAVVARLSAAGTLDTSFNAADTFAAVEGIGFVRSLALQADGKVIVGGDFPPPGDSVGTHQLARLTASGALDLTFVANFYSSIDALVLRPDGSLLIAGGSFDVNTIYRNGLVAVTGAGPSALPTISTQPVAQSAVFGGSVTFSVTATGTPAPTYQWQRNGENIPGASGASYTVTSASQANAGTYRVIVTNTAGSVPSDSVLFSVVTRNLITFYARAVVAAKGSIAGSFTIEGTQPKSVLLVGVGGTRAVPGGGGAEIPSLGSTLPTVSGLADPRLTLTDAAGTQLALNNDWGSATNLSALTAAAAQVAATPGLTATGEGVKDAAILVTLSPGTYHVKLDGADTGGGAAILQVYDTDTDNRPRLVMATLRANVASGAGVVTTGFTIDGILPKQVLIRALGEALGNSPGVLVDPLIALYRGATFINSSDDTNFSEGGSLPAAIGQTGARPIISGLDSTLVETLSPGAYTVQVSPFSSGDSGTVLFELFEADAQRAATIAPVITYLSPPQVALQNGPASFGVVVVAKPVAIYQWYKNGAPIEGAVNPVLRLENVQPGDATGYHVVVTSGATSLTSPARPLTLLPEFHSIDTDHNHRIGLLELTRIIQFYNYRVGTVRTGTYRTLAGTEDGFTLGPGSITSHHSADSNHDGAIDIIELTRVIELYNVVNGTTRTGEYHAAIGTEDGFERGPLVEKLVAPKRK